MKKKNYISPVNHQLSINKPTNNIDELRKLIDKLDNELIEILAKRMKVSEEIGNLKKQNNISSLQSNRWRELINDRLNKANNYNLDPKFIQKLFQLIHDESVKIQNDIMNK